jgi:predicted DNA binding CopG/RHH family protein
MSNKVEARLDAEAEAAEDADATSDPNTPHPAHVMVTRGHPRARNVQVRFRESEYDEIATYADQRGLPVSTVVRMLTLRAIPARRWG